MEYKVGDYISWGSLEWQEGTITYCMSNTALIWIDNFRFTSYYKGIKYNKQLEYYKFSLVGPQVGEQLLLFEV